MRPRVAFPRLAGAGNVRRKTPRAGPSPPAAPQASSGGGDTDAMNTANSRSTNYPIDPLFLQRWSPRAFTSAPMPEYELLTILEAARWAPSCYNSQPWRFIYARRDTEHWPKLLGLLNEFNQSWAKT